MKKFLILALLIGVTATTFAATTSFGDKTFQSKLSTCTPAKESKTMNIFGRNVTTVQEIKGWQNGKCVYSTYSIGTQAPKRTCYFTKSQIEEVEAEYKQTGHSERTMTRLLNDNNSCR